MQLRQPGGNRESIKLECFGPRLMRSDLCGSCWINLLVLIIYQLTVIFTLHFLPGLPQLLKGQPTDQKSLP